MRLLILLALAMAVVGCKPNRVLLGPASGWDRDQEQLYIYLIEYEEMADSRILKCDFLAGNKVACAVQYDLDD